MCVPVYSSNVSSNSESPTAGGAPGPSLITISTGVPRVIDSTPASANAPSSTTSSTSPSRFRRRMAAPKTWFVPAGRALGRRCRYPFLMRYALVTGIGRPGQVGETVAARLATDGYTLLLVDRNAADAEARAAVIRADGGRAHGFGADLSSETAVAALYADIRRSHGAGLSAYVHLAGGFAVTGPIAETAVDDWERQLTINLRTAFLVARGATPMLRTERGAVVFFSSESALPGAKVARIGSYAVAKSGLLTLAMALAQEEASNGVRVNVLAPASIRTAKNIADMGADARYVEREDVAATVSWLCSSAAQAVTGQVIRLAPR